ncbi:MarR family winged helix-turn-helix transcriptional regulator [Streptomyces sp. NPDC004134]|uniref:MarR family winged helix-turn-helix transcriptional regulator n=1 Tax=Streptomyces sp. NPDC004134 TaxID=3364691 RepID=UPI0036C72E46
MTDEGADDGWDRERIWRSMLYAQRSMWLRLTARLKKDFDLTAAEFEVLGVLREAPDHRMRATRLAAQMAYSSGSASNLFSRLVERGLVARAPYPEDARVVLIALTPDGLRLSRRAGAAHRQDLLEQFAPLVRPEEVAPLLEFTRRFEEAEGVVTSEEALPRK